MARPNTKQSEGLSPSSINMKDLDEIIETLRISSDEYGDRLGNHLHGRAYFQGKSAAYSWAYTHLSRLREGDKPWVHPRVRDAL